MKKHVNCTVESYLYDTFRKRLPEANLSYILEKAMRELLAKAGVR